MKVGFELTGSTALLMHADDIESADELMAWRKDPQNKNISRPGDDRSPGWTWQTYLYSDGKHVVMPCENIMVCIRQAGAQVILKKQKTYKEITQSGLLIDSEFCEFLAGGKKVSIDALGKIRGDSFEQQAEAVRKMGFRLWMKRAKVGTSKHIRVRPRFDTWAVRGSLHVLTPDIGYETLEMLFGIAGRVGLCDWRPGCKTPGPFGQFTAKLTKL